MLYSGHKESGLIRIFAVHWALADLDGCGGCNVQKSREVQSPPCSQWNTLPVLLRPDTFQVFGLSF